MLVEDEPPRAGPERRRCALPWQPREVAIMKTRLDTRFLAQTLVVFVALGCAAQLLHVFQSRRNARSWLYQAERFEKKGRLERTATYLGRYLDFAPHDTDALAKFGLTLDQLAVAPKDQMRVFAVLEQVLRRQPRRAGTRRHLVSVAMRLGLYSDARSHLEILLQTEPENGDYERLLGACHEANGRHAEAAVHYSRAVEFAPDQVEGYVRLADVLRRRLDQPRQAGQVMDRLVAVNAKSANAFRARARYRSDCGLLDDAARDLAKARGLEPDGAGHILEAAQALMDQGRLGEARKALAEGMDIHPNQPRLYLALAECERCADKQTQADAMLRRGLELFPKDIDLLHESFESCLRKNKPFAAEEVLARLRATSAPWYRVQFLNARRLMHEESWNDAALLLEDTRRLLNLVPDWQAQVSLSLGECYGHVGDSTRQIAVLREAVAQAPTAPAPLAALGLALSTAGECDEAVTICRQAAALPGAAPGVKTALARVLVRHNLLLPPARRDWQEVLALLDQVTAPAEAPAALLLRAEVRSAEGQPEAARQLLEQARRKHGQRLEVWAALAGWYERLGQVREAAQLWEEAHRSLPDTVQVRLAYLRAAQRWGATKRMLAELGQGLDSFPAYQQAPLLAALAAAACRLGELAFAQAWCDQLIALRPNELTTHLLRFDLALRSGDANAMRVALNDLKRADGAAGPHATYAQAALAVEQARRGDRAVLDEARVLLAHVARQRPNWARVPLLEAEVYDLNGNTERVLERLLRAAALGEREPAMTCRLMRLLAERHRYLEADQVVRQFEETAPADGELARLAAGVALHLGHRARAADLARRAVREDARDYRDRLWLAEMLAAAGQDMEAERVLRNVVRQAPSVPEAWAALVKHLARTARAAEALATVERAGKHFRPDDCALALARCYEELGRADLAARQYRTAVAARPDDFLVLRLAAEFCLRAEQPRQAEAYLRRLLDPALDVPSAPAAWARRRLAVVLADRGDERSFREALVLTVPYAAGAEEDRRAHALVLAARPEHRAEAVKRLEASAQRQPLVADEQFRLAQLYEASGDRVQAREQMLALLAADGSNAAYLAQYVQLLLDDGEKIEARPWVAKLVQVDPDHPRTRAIRARLTQGPAALP